MVRLCSLTIHEDVDSDGALSPQVPVVLSTKNTTRAIVQWCHKLLSMMLDGLIFVTTSTDGHQLGQRRSLSITRPRPTFSGTAGDAKHRVASIANHANMFVRTHRSYSGGFLMQANALHVIASNQIPVGTTTEMSRLVRATALSASMRSLKLRTTRSSK